MSLLNLNKAAISILVHDYVGYVVLEMVKDLKYEMKYLSSKDLLSAWRAWVIFYFIY